MKTLYNISQTTLYYFSDIVYKCFGLTFGASQIVEKSSQYVKNGALSIKSEKYFLKSEKWSFRYKT